MGTGLYWQEANGDRFILAGVIELIMAGVIELIM